MKKKICFVMFSVLVFSLLALPVAVSAMNGATKFDNHNTTAHFAYSVSSIKTYKYTDLGINYNFSCLDYPNAKFHVYADRVNNLIFGIKTYTTVGKSMNLSIQNGTPARPGPTWCVRWVDANPQRNKEHRFTFTALNNYSIPNTPQQIGGEVNLLSEE